MVSAAAAGFVCARSSSFPLINRGPGETARRFPQHRRRRRSGSFAQLAAPAPAPDCRPAPASASPSPFDTRLPHSFNRPLASPSPSSPTSRRASRPARPAAAADRSARMHTRAHYKYHYYLNKIIKSSMCRLARRALPARSSSSFRSPGAWLAGSLARSLAPSSIRPLGSSAY